MANRTAIYSDFKDSHEPPQLPRFPFNYFTQSGCEGRLVLRIYLDFDGVLHALPPIAGFFEHLPTLMGALRTLDDFEIVISSSWREVFTLEALREFFPEDLQSKVIGTTPVIHSAVRQVEIDQHVRSTGYAGAFVALDDANDQFPDGPDWYIPCSSWTGLSDRTIQALLAADRP